MDFCSSNEVSQLCELLNTPVFLSMRTSIDNCTTLKDITDISDFLSDTKSKIEDSPPPSNLDELNCLNDFNGLVSCAGEKLLEIKMRLLEDSKNEHERQIKIALEGMRNTIGLVDKRKPIDSIETTPIKKTKSINEINYEYLVAHAAEMTPKSPKHQYITPKPSKTSKKNSNSRPKPDLANETSTNSPEPTPSTSTQIPTENRFNVLNVDETEDPDMDLSDDTAPAEQANKNNSTGSRVAHIPPMVLANLAHPHKTLANLSALTAKSIPGRMQGPNLKIFPPDEISHRTIRKYVEENGIEFHTYELPSEKEFKVVIRGLPVNFPLEEIIAELNSRKIDHVSIHAMKNRRTGLNMPLYIVTLKKTMLNKTIYHVEAIAQLAIAVEPLRKQRGPGQCYRCQNFFHNSKNCTRQARCVKCGELHESKLCEKPIDTPPKCANCGLSHTSNYLGCPKNPLNNKPSPPQNAWEERRKAREAEIAKINEINSQSANNSVPPVAPKPDPPLNTNNKPDSKSSFESFLKVFNTEKLNGTIVHIQSILNIFNSSDTNLLDKFIQSFGIVQQILFLWTNP